MRDTLLPLPFEDFIPNNLLRGLENSPSGQALVDWMNTNYLDFEDEILEVRWFKLPERCPSFLLDELGYILSADIRAGDTERQKRRKIRNAVSSQALRGSWKYDAKVRIDNITGYDSKIFSIALSVSDDAIMLSRESSDPETYWSTMSARDGTDDLLGMWMVGDFTEPVIPGNIRIDCHDGYHTAILSAETITKLISELTNDVAPAYFILYLGYTDATGAFETYPNGIID